MLCAKEGCSLQTAGKSKYCATHRAEARKAWLDNVRKSEQERADKITAHVALWNRGRAAALEAGKNAIPTPMVVGTPTPETMWEPQGKLDPNQPQYYVEDGVCGFAWVKVRPGTSSFARWLKKQGHGYSAYRGGIDVSISDFGQSMQRKEAAAKAMAKVWADAGINCYAQSRMD